MSLPLTYTVTPQPEQNATSQTWWQGLFDLGREAIRRALPVPGEPQGGVPGVPLRPSQRVGQVNDQKERAGILETNVAGIPVMLILAGVVLFLVVRR